MNAVSLTVIIPSAGPIGKLDRLLQSLKRQVLPLHWETVVVANPHCKEKEQMVTRLGGRYFSINPNGANRARNRGIDQAKGQLLVFFDDDCILEDTELLAKHWAMHQEKPNFAAIGGFYRNSGGRRIDSSYAQNQQRWLMAGQMQDGGEAEYLIGGHFSYKRSELGQSRFDEEIRFGGTETEFFLRMRRAGQRFLLTEDLIVQHDFQLSPWSLASKAFRQGRGLTYRLNRGLNYRQDRKVSEFPHEFWDHYYNVFFRIGMGLKSKSDLTLVR